MPLIFRVNRSTVAIVAVLLRGDEGQNVLHDFVSEASEITLAGAAFRRGQRERFAKSNGDWRSFEA